MYVTITWYNLMELLKLVFNFKKHYKNMQGDPYIIQNIYAYISIYSINILFRYTVRSCLYISIKFWSFSSLSLHMFENFCVYNVGIICIYNTSIYTEIMCLKLNKWGFSGGSVVKNLSVNAGNTGSILVRGRSHMSQDS